MSNSARSVAGVYYIHRVGTGDYYVGSSNDVKKRKKQHLTALKSGVHHSTRLKNAWNKYGEAAFEFATIQVVTFHKDPKVVAKALIDAEDFWFALYARALGKPPAYNMAPVAGSNLGHKMSPESIKKMQIAAAVRCTPEMCARMSAIQKGRKQRKTPISAAEKARTGARARGRIHSAVERAKMSESHMNMSAEARANMCANQSASARRRWDSIESAEDRANLAEIAKVRDYSPETRAKMSSSTGWWIGKKHSPETRAKMSTKAKERCTPEWRANIAAASRGRTHSPEARAKMSATRTGRKRGPYRKRAG